MSWEYMKMELDLTMRVRCHTPVYADNEETGERELVEYPNFTMAGMDGWEMVSMVSAMDFVIKYQLNRSLDDTTAYIAVFKREVE